MRWRSGHENRRGHENILSICMAHYIAMIDDGNDDVDGEDAVATKGTTGMDKKDKPTKWRIKLPLLVDSSNGHTVNFQIYAGQIHTHTHTAWWQTSCPTLIIIYNLELICRTGTEIDQLCQVQLMSHKDYQNELVSQLYGVDSRGVLRKSSTDHIPWKQMLAKRLHKATGWASTYTKWTKWGTSFSMFTK